MGLLELIRGQAFVTSEDGQKYVQFRNGMTVELDKDLSDLSNKEVQERLTYINDCQDALQHTPSDRGLFDIYFVLLFVVLIGVAQGSVPAYVVGGLIAILVVGILGWSVSNLYWLQKGEMKARHELSSEAVKCISKLQNERNVEQ